MDSASLRRSSVLRALGFSARSAMMCDGRMVEGRMAADDMYARVCARACVRACFGGMKLGVVVVAVVCICVCARAWSDLSVFPHTPRLRTLLRGLSGIGQRRALY